MKAASLSLLIATVTHAIACVGTMSATSDSGQNRDASGPDSITNRLDGSTPDNDAAVTQTPDGFTLYDASPFVAPSCATPPQPGLPTGSPPLNPGTWTHLLGNENIPWADNVFTQGVAVHPCNPAIIYAGVCAFDVSYGGLFRSTDAGATWARVGRIAPTPTSGGAAPMLDEPIQIRIDPRDPQHLYVGDGVRGGSEGFWVSHDGGDTFSQPAGFANLMSSEGLLNYDIYDVATDPADFNHVLLSSHSAWGWTDTQWNANAGILESRDGGDTWIVHHPMNGWGFGHSIAFLYNPTLGIGDSNTWLLGTQGSGLWRTSNAGATWTDVPDDQIQHGGSTIYYDHAGVLYAAGTPHNHRSTDNGVTWTSLDMTPGANCVFGDGTTLYSHSVNGTGFGTSPESDGLHWTDPPGPQPAADPYAMAFDPVNRIVYSSSWTSGIWALKLP